MDFVILMETAAGKFPMKKDVFLKEVPTLFGHFETVLTTSTISPSVLNALWARHIKTYLTPKSNILLKYLKENSKLDKNKI